MEKNESKKVITQLQGTKERVLEVLGLNGLSSWPIDLMFRRVFPKQKKWTQIDEQNQQCLMDSKKLIDPVIILSDECACVGDKIGFRSI